MKFDLNRENDLRNAGCEKVESYMLVNNYGYTFIKDGIKYDLRHWLNFYGEDVDYWTLDGRNSKLIGHGSFKNCDEAIEFIKTL